MLRWFKRPDSEIARRQVKLDAALQLMDRYGALLESLGTLVVDESKLPASKDQIVAACKIAMLSAKNENARDAVEVCWYSLCFFQREVGDADVRHPPLDTIMSEQGDQHLRLVNDWIAITTAEGAQRRTDIDAFKRQISN